MSEKGYRAETCNICGSDRYRQIHYFAQWNLGREPVSNVAIVQCRNCGVRRRMPGIVDDYEETYHQPYVEQGASIHPHQLSHFADLMTARLRKFNEAGVRLLDVGCSTGRVLNLAKVLGFHPVGLDYSNWAVKHCRKLGFEVLHGSLVGQWETGEQFDIVHCSHTIEHVPDPILYLNEMHRLLKKNGHLMLACPNYGSLPRVILRDRWGTYCLDSHLWQFTARQMRKLLEKVGFRVLILRTLHGFDPDSHMKRRVLDLAALAGFGDGLNIIAIRD